MDNNACLHFLLLKKVTLRYLSALLCKNIDELKQQFILINSTRPLPKTLIYELLPSVDGLPEKYTTRKFAAKIVSELNHRSDSASWTNQTTYVF